MTLNHGREFLKGGQPLPAEATLPIIDEASRPAFSLVAPESSEGLLEQVDGVEPLVGGDQGLERLTTVQRQVVPVRQQGIAAALDEAALVALHPRICAPTHTSSKASFR